MALPPLLLKFKNLRDSTNITIDRMNERDLEVARLISAYSAQLIRYSTRLAALESGASGGEGAGGGSMGPSGYEYEGSQVAPVSIVPEGVQTPDGAALSIIVE